MRLSFAGLTPEQIRKGLAILGRTIGAELEIRRGTASLRPQRSRSPERGADYVQSSREKFRLKVGLAEMLKGGVIMDVTNAEQARIAEDAGASR